MELPGVLMVSPTTPYLEQELEKRFKVYKPWTRPDSASTSAAKYLAENSGSIRAAVVTTRSGADAELIDSLPNLEIVSTFSVGYDKIDLGKCRERGIRVTNTPDVLTDDVADAAVGLALAVVRRICVSDGLVRRGKVGVCDGGFGTMFSGKSIGIVGLGRIGTAIAKRAKAFGCKISYFSRTPKPSLPYNFYPNIINLASNSHILIVACSLTDQTRHIIDRQVIDALGPEGIVINVGRGAHIDEPELVAALVEGRLGGAGLDVYEDQPNVPEELLGLENVVLLPYVGSETVETTDGMADLVVKNLEAHFMKKPLLSPVV